jgi:hypothetical protein
MLAGDRFVAAEPVDRGPDDLRSVREHHRVKHNHQQSEIARTRHQPIPAGHPTIERDAYGLPRGNFNRADMPK